MAKTVDALLESIAQALALMKARGETRHAADVENLVRVRRVLEGLDPDEVDALLEDEGVNYEDEEE